MMRQERKNISFYLQGFKWNYKKKLRVIQSIFQTALSAVILTVYIKNGKIMSTKGTRGGMNAGYNTNRMHQPAAQYPVFFSYYLIYINLLRKGEINYGITESYNQQPTGTSHETGRSIR